MKPVRVINLSTLEEKTYVGITPEQAVVAAHAQEHGDWNTWDYATRYTHRTGDFSVCCGDWETERTGIEGQKATLL